MAINLENIAEMQLIKFNLFKEQNPEIGRYDVTFEVEGKILYAHKLMLTLISDTFDSMLSERWTKKDEAIKIKDYGYDNFYQFLTFLYSGRCELNDLNIYSMVDIAEFYGVALFKNYCERYLSSMKITAENIFQLMDFTEKYSMGQLKISTLHFVSNNFQVFVESGGFLKAIKSFIEGLVVVGKDKIYAEDLFLAIYKWSEKQALDKQSADPNLNLNDAIKTDFSDFLQTVNILKLSTSMCGSWNRRFKRPSAPSLIKNRKDIEWYLIQYLDGKIGITHASYKQTSCYNIAELTAGTSGFDNARDCKIALE